ncbi:TPA: helix-turn-helix transcriptional regulator [Serratia fonticola]
MSGMNKNAKERADVTAMVASGAVLPSFDERMCWSFVVVDVCDYGRQGLVFALKETMHVEGKKEVFAFPSLDIALSLRWPVRSNRIMQCLVVRLPPVDQEALLMLLQLSELVQRTVVEGFQIVVISPFDQVLTRRLMEVMGGGEFTVIDARLPISLLCREIFVEMMRESLIQDGLRVSSILSPNERKALFLSLQNRNVHQQARSRRISPKTIYTQRRSALRRLGVPNILSLLRLFNAKKYRTA